MDYLYTMDDCRSICQRCEPIRSIQSTYYVSTWACMLWHCCPVLHVNAWCYRREGLRSSSLNSKESVDSHTNWSTNWCHCSGTLGSWSISEFINFKGFYDGPQIKTFTVGTRTIVKGNEWNIIILVIHNMQIYNKIM